MSKAILSRFRSVSVCHCLYCAMCICVINAIDGIYSLGLCRINSQWMNCSAFGQTFNVYNSQTSMQQLHSNSCDLYDSISFLLYSMPLCISPAAAHTPRSSSLVGIFLCFYVSIVILYMNFEISFSKLGNSDVKIRWMKYNVAYATKSIDIWLWSLQPQRTNCTKS